MARCYDLQMDAGVDGLIACGSLGEGPMLSHDERIDVFKTVQQRDQGQAGAADRGRSLDREACRLAERGAKAGASGLMVVPSTIYHTNRDETLASLRAVAEASDLPIMVYSNRLAYRVDVTNDMLLELTEDKRFVAVKESSDDLRRTTEAVALLEGKMAVFTGVDNYAYEAALVGAAGWIAGLVVAFPQGDRRGLEAGQGRPARRGADDLPLVPPAARSRCLDLPGPEHQARRGAGDQLQRARPPAAHAALRRASHVGREDRTGRDCDAAGIACAELAGS